MSYQVNFRLFVCDCEFWEAEAISKLQAELQKACDKVVSDNHIKGKTLALSPAEVTYLTR